MNIPANLLAAFGAAWTADFDLLAEKVDMLDGEQLEHLADVGNLLNIRAGLKLQERRANRKETQ